MDIYILIKNNCKVENVNCNYATIQGVCRYEGAGACIIHGDIMPDEETRNIQIGDIVYLYNQSSKTAVPVKIIQIKRMEKSSFDDFIYPVLYDVMYLNNGQILKELLPHSIVR